MHKLDAKAPDQCSDCSGVTYPPQGFCRACLSENVTAVQMPVSGEIMAASKLHYSLEGVFQAHLPLTLLSVEIVPGTVVFAVAEEEIDAGEKVSVAPKTYVYGHLLTAVKEV